MVEQATQSQDGGSNPTPSLQFFVKEITTTEAKPLILNYHYSHLLPANKVVVFGAFIEDRLQSLAWFGRPFGWKHKVIELTRLVRIPSSHISLSKFLSHCCKRLKNYPDCHLLISYADPYFGHHGGIYQASGFAYDGQGSRSTNGNTNSFDGYIINGEFVPWRTCVKRYGVASLRKLRELLTVSVEARRRPLKHLYWRALDEKGKQQAVECSMQTLEFPKPLVHTEIDYLHRKTRNPSLDARLKAIGTSVQQEVSQ